MGEKEDISMEIYYMSLKIKAIKWSNNAKD